MNSALPPSRMSVPRPAMFVAIVTAPFRPAWATISASCAWYFAFSTTCLHAAPLEHRREALRLLDGDRADQHRAARCLLLDDVRDDGVVLLALGPVDDVRLLEPQQRPVRRDHHHVEVVDLPELLGLGLGRAGHAGELLVHAEVVLEGDRRERLVLALDLHLLLGLDGLVQAVAPAPPRHQPAGELVDDDHLAVLDHVVDVAPEQRVGAQRLVRCGGAAACWPGRRARPAAGGPPSIFSAFAIPLSVSVHRLVLLVDEVVAGGLEGLAVLGLRVAARHRARLEARDDPIDLVVQLGRFLGRARDDQRRPGLVDEDAVHLVHDREVMLPLHVAARARTSCCRGGSRSRTRCSCRT